MEALKVLDYSNVFIASYFTDDRQCSHPNREHTLIYICSGELEIKDGSKHITLHQGQCAFMRRDHRMILQKHVKNGIPYQSVVLKFSRNFLRDFFHTIDKNTLPEKSKRDKRSLTILPFERPDIKSLFESIIPYFDAEIKPSEELLKLKMIEGLYLLLNTDKNLYASLFDFTEPWKIDIIDYMNNNYMYDLSMDEMASNTGRSLTTFKRDFKKISDLPPGKWLIKRRLEAAHDLITTQRRKISDACYEVGFKNLSHFSKAYKDSYGFSPVNSIT